MGKLLRLVGYFGEKENGTNPELRHDYPRTQRISRKYSLASLDDSLNSKSTTGSPLLRLKHAGPPYTNGPYGRQEPRQRRHRKQDPPHAYVGHGIGGPHAKE